MSDTRRRIHGLKLRNKKHFSFKLGCAEKLLRLAKVIYQCERWKMELDNKPEYQYPSKDQDNKDVDRPVGHAEGHTDGHAAGNVNRSPPQEQQVQRPSTALSEGINNTTGTPEPSYSLLDKRKRNFALGNDPKLERRQQKRARNAVTAKPRSHKPKKRGPKKLTNDHTSGNLIEVDDAIIRIRPGTTAETRT
ncbi:hypothetical protein QBC32DRAFT_386530 [Pseudoneurospora amorphoporcata]|uniref:Uncharacterized protein n=1 Tax=Pseudoneurospora amorphoporcata TaxID=241081 RepID=A0AAN6NJI8_9PEZI|nr:hypothetical protein QBC32DRAFT_386530 [Pseudoneurospora amorphoporcata]